MTTGRSSTLQVLSLQIFSALEVNVTALAELQPELCHARARQKRHKRGADEESPWRQQLTNAASKRREFK